MSYILNDPGAFASESADGFVAAHHTLVRRVAGGVVRANPTPPGQVAVVIGGGSGHYPAFAGLVGPGLAHGAAMGNVFASPSAQQILNVARNAATSAGVLLSYGNYAGDVLNFDQAEARLRADGVPCTTVRVTDDIYSGTPDERHKRRGIAGDLAVFRAACWAAEQGLDLDGVALVAARANDRTRTIGVAFTGCTLPGASEPLFTVPAGQMAVGMGIHGEPGIETVPIPTADELGRLMVSRVLDEIPDDIPQADGARVAVIVNGLGSVKSEELFLLYGVIAEALAEAGVVIVEPEVGEFATSFEMAGVSLTLFWLDEELEAAWSSPAHSAAYRKGSVAAAGPGQADPEADLPTLFYEVAEASPESVAGAPVVAEAIAAIREIIDARAEDLGRLDSVAGDGDHGIGMQRGARAAAEAAKNAQEQGSGAGTVLCRAADAWADRAGGTSGALWGAGLRAAGESLGDDRRPDRERVVAAVAAARDAVQEFGKAQVGDKTLVDALVPFVDALTRSVAGGETLADAWVAAARSATDAAEATADLVARLGRARVHADSSLGTPDPGAVSLAMAVTVVGEVLQTTTTRKAHR